ncbi:TRAP-type C4-dicarboxylate transport system, small permease component [Desulfocicer vacuolatum DSM 3385]|uniref:TRAP-type C4-dicarboxylate transport system, small permease component n=1 Tax=Desulfocicer vacuolatum DSM 3385 TaxID=1121400 RepID=A0A1W1YSD7_9BACT|nr:TRAP transporter small permease [Desulfocicer vacuolatum]SMC39022.1 TRAP-type C4-dicarboxylate transport system, small permease component [Desulfocicer vacuolatum DSM 3385]
MITVLNKTSKILSNILVNIAAATLIFWVFIIVIFVSARAFFNVNWMFVEEYTGYGMVLLTSFSFAYALRRGAHVKVTAVADNIPKKLQRPLKIFADLVGLIVALYLTWHGIQWLMHGIEGGERSWFPSRTLMWPVYALIPIGLGVLSLEFLNQLVLNLSGSQEEREEQK